MMVQLGVLLLAGAASAPPAPSAPATPPAGQTLACADFQRQPDGTWTPRRPVTVGGMTVTPAMSFSRGVSFDGVDAAAVLEAHCRRPRGQ